MNEIELLVRDLYGKYAPNSFSEDKISYVKENYENPEDFVRDFYGKYAPEEYSEDKIQYIRENYLSNTQEDAESLGKEKGAQSVAAPVAPTPLVDGKEQEMQSETSSTEQPIVSPEQQLKSLEEQKLSSIAVTPFPEGSEQQVDLESKINKNLKGFDLGLSEKLVDKLGTEATIEQAEEMNQRLSEVKDSLVVESNDIKLEQEKLYEEANKLRQSGIVTEEDVDAFKMRENAIKEKAETLSNRINAYRAESEYVSNLEFNAKAKKGNWLGATWNWMLEGVGSTAAGETDYLIELFAATMPDEMIADPNLTEEERREALDKTKLEMRSYLRRSTKEVAGSESVTDEFMRKKEEGFFGGAWAGLVKSAPAMASPYMSGIFFQTSEAVEQELEGVEGVSSGEKMLIKAPLAVATAALERVGLKNVVKNQAVAKVILKKAIDKTPKSASASTFKKILDEEVGSGIETYLSKGVNGFIAEAETGGLQTATEIGYKNLYEDITDKDIFEAPTEAGEIMYQVIEGAAQEGVGGLIMSQPYALSKALKNRSLRKEINNPQFDFIEAIATNDDMRNSIIDRIDRRRNNGLLTEEEATEQKQALNEAARVISDIGEGFSTEQKIQLFDLVIEQDNVNSEIENLKSKNQSIHKSKIETLEAKANKIEEDIQKVVLGQESETQTDETTEKEEGGLTDVQSEIMSDVDNLGDDEVKLYRFNSPEEAPVLLRDKLVKQEGTKGEVQRVNFLGIPIGKKKQTKAPDSYTLTITGKELRDAKKEYEKQTEEESMLEGVRDARDEKTEGQESTELRAKEEVETAPVEEQAEISKEEKVKIAEKIGRTRKVKSKNVSGLIDVMGGIFGLNKPQAQSAAVVGDVMIGNSAKRAGVSKDEMYQRIAFQKVNEKDLPQGVKFQVDAFHGSPYQFDKFTTEKIGAGEGAQAFGWGLYFTDLESIARHYAEKLGGSGLYINGGEINRKLNFEKYTAAYDIASLGYEKALERQLELKNDNFYDENTSNKIIENIKSLKDSTVEFKKKGVQYKVSLHKGKTPDQYTWLEWDKPIDKDTATKIAEGFVRNNPTKYVETDKQYEDSFKEVENEDGDTDLVTDIINSKETLVRFFTGMNGEDVYNFINDGFSSEQLSQEEEIYQSVYGKERNNQKQASLFLLENGIDGIRYPAESISRGVTSDTARGFNYVVFDENAVSIEEVIKFQKDANKARGAMMTAMDSQAIIYALTDPNVSTPLHELAHVYEHYLTDAERKQIEKWSGHKSGTTEFSEAFARGFEKFLADGKVNNPKLQKIFESFKQWLTDIYNGIKGSDIDVKLNDEMRSIYDQMLSEEVTEVKEKPKPKKRGKTQIQKAIDEFVDKKIPSTDKVSMSEKQALNKQIRDFARGMREAYKDQRNFRKRANKLISDNFQLFGDLTPSKVKALTRRALNIDFSKPDSLDKFIDYAAGLEQKTEDNLYKDIVNDVKKKTSPSKLRKRKGGILRGKIANYEGKVLSNIHNFIKENDVDALQNRVNQLRNKQEQGVKLSENDIALLDGAIMSIELLSGNLNTAQNAQAKIEAIIEGGKSKYRENIEKRATEYARLVIEALPAITGGKKLTDQFGKLEQGAKRRPLTEAIRERLTGFLDYGEGLRTLLDKIDRTAERDESGYGGFLDKEAYEPVAKGRRKKDSLDTLKINELSDKLNELYGKRKKKALRENQKPKNLGTFTDGNGNEVNLFLSQNQAYPLYQYMQDPNNMATFQEMGFTDEMLQAVEDFLTPEVKEWADWQMSEFFPKYYDEINAVYKEMNDIDLPKQKIYVPIIRNVDGLNEAQRGVNETLFGDPQSTYKSLKQRQNSKAPFDMTKDGNEKLMEYVEGMNRYIAFSKPVKILNVIFKNKDVRNAIKEFNSTETLTAIDGFIEGIANNSSNMGQRIALLDKIRGNVTIASLALAPTVTIKQLTSIPAYAADIPISKFISGLGAFARNPKKVHDILMESEYMQRRYKDGFERDLEGMKRDYDDMLNGTSNLKNKLMFLIKWGDKGAILMGGYSVYKYHFDKSRAEGKSIGESKKIALSKFEEATKLSQQSTNIEDLSFFQRMGSLGKLFTMYMTSPISYFRQERKSARDFVKGYKSGNKKLMRNAVKRFTIYHFALPLVFQYVASGLPGLLTDWDEEDEKDLMRAASIGSLNGVFIAGQLISYFGDILTDKAWVRGGKFSPSPAFDAIVDIMNESEDVIDEWSKNPNKFSDDFMKEMIELGLSVDVAVGLPVNRVKKLIENWKTIADDNTLEVQEEIALGLGFSPYVVTPKKKAKTSQRKNIRKTRLKKSNRQLRRKKQKNKNSK